MEKLSDSLSYPPRCLRAERAGAYIGVSRSTFLEWVDDGTMPRPIKVGGVTLFDRIEIDACIDELKSKRDGASKRNTVREILRMH